MMQRCLEILACGSWTRWFQGALSSLDFTLFTQEILLLGHAHGSTSALFISSIGKFIGWYKIVEILLLLLILS